MADTTDDPGTTQPTRPSRLNQALAWVGIVAGELGIAPVAAEAMYGLAGKSIASI